MKQFLAFFRIFIYFYFIIIIIIIIIILLLYCGRVVAADTMMGTAVWGRSLGPCGSPNGFGLYHPWYRRQRGETGKQYLSFIMQGV